MRESLEKLRRWNWERITSITANIATISAVCVAVDSLSTWKDEDQHQRAVELLQSVRYNLGQVRRIASERPSVVAQQLQSHGQLSVAERNEFRGLFQRAPDYYDMRLIRPVDTKIAEYLVLRLREDLAAIDSLARCIRDDLEILCLMGDISADEYETVDSYLWSARVRFFEYMDKVRELFYLAREAPDTEYSTTRDVSKIHAEYFEHDPRNRGFVWPLSRQADSIEGLVSRRLQRKVRP